MTNIHNTSTSRIESEATCITTLFNYALDIDERVACWEAPLSLELEKKALGRVIGGGTYFRKNRPAVTEVVIYTVDIQRALRSIKHELMKLKAPTGTAVSYIDADFAYFEIVGGTGWSTEILPAGVRPPFHLDVQSH